MRGSQQNHQLSEDNGVLAHPSIIHLKNFVVGGKLRESYGVTHKHFGAPKNGVIHKPAHGTSSIIDFFSDC